MRFLIFNYLLLLSLNLFSQQELPVFDGVVNQAEWENANFFEINYEISPGNNIPTPYPTEVFITYSETELYVGFIAYADMEKLRSSVRNRDEGFQDDNVFIGIDTYGDGRYMIGIGVINWMLNYFLQGMMMFLMILILNQKLVNMKIVTMWSLKFLLVCFNLNRPL